MAFVHIDGKLRKVWGRLRILEPSERNFMLILLAWVAGSIDAISYFELGHVFTANMTGNTVLLGLALAQGQILGSLRSASALLGFVLGIALGAAIVGRDRKRGEWSPVVTFSIVIEGSFIGIFTLASRILGIQLTGVTVYALIILLGIAMGIQTASIRHLDIAGVATTFMTGTLTSLIVGIIGWVGPADFPTADISRSPNSQKPKSAIRLLGAVYGIYFVSAVAGGFVETHTEHWAVLLPLSALILVVLLSLYYHHN